MSDKKSDTKINTRTKLSVSIQSKLKLLGLFLVFFGPLFIAMLMYFNPVVSNLIPQKKTNHGVLITPAQMLEPLSAVNENNQPLAADLFKGKWTLLYWGGNDCNLYCEAELFKLRQVHLSLGRDMTRVQAMYLMLQTTSQPRLQQMFKRLIKRNPKLLIAKIQKDTPIAEQMQNFALGQTYLIDAHGNLILEYSPDITTKGMFKDVKKILRVSKIG